MAKCKREKLRKNRQKLGMNIRLMNKAAKAFMHKSPILVRPECKKPKESKNFFFVSKTRKKLWSLFTYQRVEGAPKYFEMLHESANK